MSAVFYKFPTTPHLADLSGVVQRIDKILSDTERAHFLSQAIVVEEKIDGANLGISFDNKGNLLLQNRGNLLLPPYIGQWKPLGAWLHARMDTLFDTLSDKYILFGEWCYARHTIAYNRLPDYFLGFDIFDIATQTFFTTKQRDALLYAVNLTAVPRLLEGCFTLPELISMSRQSHYADGTAEGLYLRHENTHILETRAKLVCPEFMQSLEEHWSRTSIVPNALI